MGRRTFRKTSQSELSNDQLKEQIVNGSRFHLAKGITLLESKKREDKERSQQLLQSLLPHTGNSLRIGISGVPGAGKSTFIETFGIMLCEKGFKVAVLAIDPSSTVTGGSILGDKTRMEELAKHPNAFIRPSPTAGTLGGVHQKTRETMLLCEAAGYDIILIETVGVGQSEVAVRNMVDVFLLLVLTGAGDELQGMKKGIMEIADFLLVHKADGDNEKLAKKTVRELKQMLHFLQPATPHWETMAMPISSLTKNGIDELWSYLELFKERTIQNNTFEKRRNEQTIHWYHEMIEEMIIRQFYENEERKHSIMQFEKNIIEQKMTVSQALFSLFQDKKI